MSGTCIDDDAATFRLPSERNDEWLSNRTGSGTEDYVTVRHGFL